MPSRDRNQALLDALYRETDPTSQSAIIEQLGARSVTAAVKPLIALVELNDYQSGPAIAALGNIGDPRAIGVLIRCFERRNLAWIAKDALVKIGEDALEPLLDALQAPGLDVRFMALRTLGELRDPRSIAPLEQFIASEDDAVNRQFARTTLKTVLLDALTHADTAWRLEAIAGLQRLNDARTIPALEARAAADRSAEVCAAAEAAIPSLIAHVDRDPFAEHDLPLTSRETRLAFNALRKHIAREGALPDPDHQPAETLAALQALAGEYDDTAAAKIRDCIYLLAADTLRSADPSVRLVAVQGLGWLCDASTARLLAPVAAHDPDSRVREAARALC